MPFAVRCGKGRVIRMPNTAVAAKEKKLSPPGPSAKKKNKLWIKIKNQKYLYALMAIPVAWYVIFCYIPMGGLVLAFKDFRFADGIFGSPNVGFQNFINLFTDYWFPLILRNTIATSLLKMVIGFPFPILFAVFLNELRSNKLKRTAQTISYLPYFVSWVVVIGILRLLLSADGGMINRLLMAFGILDQPVSFMLQPDFIWPVAVASDIWKNMGWNSIIYLAAITGINQELYEAADIDGAGRFRKIWSITLPCIRSTIMILFILNIGSLFTSNFDQMWMLNVGPVGEVAETIDTYIYRMGLKNLNYGVGTALNIVRTIVVFALIAGTNKIAKLFGEDGIW